jgi:hypothetical protein
MLEETGHTQTGRGIIEAYFFLAPISVLLQEAFD